MQQVINKEMEEARQNIQIWRETWGDNPYAILECITREIKIQNGYVKYGFSLHFNSSDEETETAWIHGTNTKGHETKRYFKTIAQCVEVLCNELQEKLDNGTFKFTA